MMWLIANPEIDVQDTILETLSFVAYFFILISAVYTKKKNKIFASKGFPVMICAILLGIISSFMDLFTEFFWIEINYEIYKMSMSIIQITGLILFALSLSLVFKFTKFLMGEE